MCLSTAYKTSEPDSIIMEYVSKIEVEGNLITLTDVIGDKKQWKVPLRWLTSPAGS